MAVNDVTIQVGADINPAVGPLRKVEESLKRIQASAFNLKLNPRNFSEPLGRITGQASEFEKSMGAANARVISFAASAGIFFQVTRSLKETVRAAVEVEKSLADINVILDKDTKTLNKFGKELFKVASSTGQSFGTVAEAATELARQGLSITETQKRVKDALILTRLSGMSAKDSVESLTAALNTFKDVGLTSSQVINKLAKVDAAFAVSTGDLAEALKRVGSTAQDVGVTFDQLNGLVTSLQQTTARGGSTIGNALKTIFTRVGRPETLRQLEALGLSVRDAQKNTLPAVQILKQLAGVYGSLSDAQKSDITQTVAGVFQKNILIATLKDLSRANSEYERATLASASATDEANKRNEELNKTLAAQTQRLLNNFKQAGSAIGGNVFGPSIDFLFSGFNKILESGDSSNQFVQAGLRIGDDLTKGIGKALSGPGLAIFGIVTKNILYQFYTFSRDVFKELKNMGTAAQSLANIERNISNILTSQPDILARIAKGQTSIAVEAAKVTEQLLAQRNIQAAIAGTAPAMARSVAAQAGGIKNFGSTGSLKVMGAAGGVPQMFGSLGGAINNEIRAGIPRSAIRINSSSALATRSNPAGLAVTNIKDEPMGLRSLGIPNFAGGGQFVTTKGTSGGKMKLTSQALSEFEQVLKKISQTGNFAVDELRNFEDQIRKNKGSLKIFREEISKSYSEYRNLRVENIGKISPTGVLANKPVTSGMEIMLSGQLSALNKEVTEGIQKRIREDLEKKYNRKGSLLTGERTRVSPITDPKYLLPQYAGGFDPLYGPSIPSPFQMYGTGSMFGPAIPTARERRMGSLRKFGKNIKSGATKFGEKLSSGKGMGAAFIGSSLLSTAAPESKITSVANMAITGGILGSMFTPLGAAIGTAAGGLLGLAMSASKAEKVFSEFEIKLKENTEVQGNIARDLSDLFSTEQVGPKRFSISGQGTGRLGMGSVTDITKQRSFLTDQSKANAANQIFNLLGGGSIQDRQQLINLARFSVSAGGIGSAGKDPVKAIGNLTKYLPKDQAANVRFGLLGLGEDKMKQVFSPEVMSILAERFRGKAGGISIGGGNIPLDFTAASLMMGQTANLQNVASNAAIQRGAASKIFDLQSGFNQRGLFGNELFNARFSASKQGIANQQISANEQALYSREIAKRSAFQNAAKTLNRAGFGGELDIFKKLMSGGETQIKEYSKDATEENRRTLDSLGRELLQIEENYNSAREKAAETAVADLEVARKTLELKKKEFETELQIQRELQQKTALRNFRDAKGQFARGSIGGAALAGAAQSSLDANIAARGFRRSDYGTGFNIAIRRNFQRNDYDVFQSTIRAVDDLSVALKDGLTTAIADTVLQARSAREAFSGLANALSRIALERGLDMFMTAALSKINFGGVQKFAKGGLVNGGSSANVDTVPAMLTGGEFVLRRSAVNRIGVNNLNAINSGGFAGLQSGGYANVNLNNSTDFLGNPSRPTGMSFNIDPSLSAFALTSSMNRQNQIRDQKAKQYFSYRKNQLAAMAAYKKQIRGRRYGALFGAAAAFAGAGIASMGGIQGMSAANAGTGAPSGLGASADFINGPQLMMANSGGSIPSMLTGGEFVINSQAASRMGSANLGRLNSGGASLGAGSSIGSQENGADRVVEAIKELKSIFDNKNSGNSFKPSSQVGQNSGSPISVTVPVSVNVTSVGAETAPRTDMENSNATEEADSRQMMAKQLGETIRGSVLQELEKQQRPGGMLYKMQNR